MSSANRIIGKRREDMAALGNEFETNVRIRRGPDFDFYVFLTYR